jgi:hypothetical protein
MRVHIKTTVNVPEIPREVELEAGTLRDVLTKVFGHVHFAKELKDPVTGEIKFDGIFEVRLNDTPYYSLPNGVDTDLDDGDTIALSFILLGGG